MKINLINLNVQIVAEGSNMGCDKDAIEIFNNNNIFYAGGKMANGGAVPKTKGYFKGGKTMTTKGSAAGGKMRPKGMAAGGTVARGSGAARPQMFRKDG